MDASHVYAHARMHHVRIVERRNPQPLTRERVRSGGGCPGPGVEFDLPHEE